ncbi:MAG: BON domain-containing protein [Bacteroidota bacterium]
MNPTTDELIKQNIVDHLIWDNRIDANNIKVVVDEGVAKLEGTVPDILSKTNAEKDVFQVEGVKMVENHLDVAFHTEKTRPQDSLIATNIENKLLWNNQIDESDIHVSCFNGIVTLEGSTPSYWQKKLAEDIAISSDGVMMVRNEISVKVVKSVVDMDIEKDIRNAFQRSIMIEEDKIDVVVNNGTAILTGIVPFYAMKREALDIAMFTAGVIHVRDEITIG